MDASALLEYLLRTDAASAMGEVIRTPEADLHVPALCDVEVVSGLRRALRLDALSDARASEALEDYADLPLTRHGHQGLLHRIFGLRANFSAYDAACVALAEQLNCGLLTADERLARAARDYTSVAVLG